VRFTISGASDNRDIHDCRFLPVAFHQGTPTLIVFYAENQFLILVLRLNFVTQSAQVVSQLRVLYCKISYKI